MRCCDFIVVKPKVRRRPLVTHEFLQVYTFFTSISKALKFQLRVANADERLACQGVLDVQHFDNGLFVGVDVNQALRFDLVQKAGVFVFELFFLSLLFF